jgi:hypothetical protein
MQLSYTKTTAAVLWVLAMGAVGIALGTTSLTGWIVLAGLAFLPPLVIGRLWKEEPTAA